MTEEDFNRLLYELKLRLTNAFQGMKSRSRTNWLQIIRDTFKELAPAIYSPDLKVEIYPNPDDHLKISFVIHSDPAIQVTINL